MRSKKITQQFGENKACRFPSGLIVGKLPNGSCPVITSQGKRYASVDFYRDHLRMKGHNGVDIAAIEGEAVVHCATFGGTMYTEKDRMGGLGVDVVSEEKIRLKDGTESYIKVRYWHLKVPIGWDGKKVRYGQMIGLAGNTGASSGPHLHMGIKKCDKDGNSLEKGNGYYGAFDPEPYYGHNIYAADSAEYFGIPPEPLTEEEKNEIRIQISVITRVILHLREKLARM